MPIDCMGRERRDTIYTTPGAHVLFARRPSLGCGP